MIKDLTALKDLCETARYGLDRGKEPIEELTKIRDFIGHLASNPQDLKEESEDFQKFFFSEMTPGVIRRITKERSSDEKVSEWNSLRVLVPGHHRRTAQKLPIPHD